MVPGPDRGPAGELPPVPGVLRPRPRAPALDGHGRAGPDLARTAGRLIPGRREDGERARAASCTSTWTRSSCPSSAASTLAAGRPRDRGRRRRLRRAWSPPPAREARDAGRPGRPVGRGGAAARAPTAVFRPGDLEAYARVSDDVTAILLAAQPARRAALRRRGLRRPHAAKRPAPPPGPAPPRRIKDELQRRLRLDASLGLAVLAARRARRVAWARPRGLLVVLPGYEASFLARQPLAVLPDLPPHLETALRARRASRRSARSPRRDDAALAGASAHAAAARLRAGGARRGRGRRSPWPRPPALDPGGGAGARPAHRRARRCATSLEGLARPRLPAAAALRARRRQRCRSRSSAPASARAAARTCEPRQSPTRTRCGAWRAPWPSPCSTRRRRARVQVRLTPADRPARRRRCSPQRPSRYNRAARGRRIAMKRQPRDSARPKRARAQPRTTGDARPRGPPPADEPRAARSGSSTSSRQAHPEADLRAALPQRLRAGGGDDPLRPVHRRAREPGHARAVRALPRRRRPGAGASRPSWRS